MYKARYKYLGSYRALIIGLIMLPYAAFGQGTLMGVIASQHTATGDTVSLAKFQFGPTGAGSAAGYQAILGDPYTSNMSGTQNGITAATVGQGQGTYWGHSLGLNSYNGGKTTGSNSGIRPDNILQNFIFSYEDGSTNTTNNVQITGLSANADYILKVGGSRTSSGGTSSHQLGIMAYVYNSTEYTLDVTDNTSREVIIPVTSDATGKVVFGVHKLLTAVDDQYTGYLGWLEVLQIQ